MKTSFVKKVNEIFENKDNSSKRNKEESDRIKDYKKYLKLQKKTNRAKYGIGKKYTLFLITMITTCLAVGALIVFLFYEYKRPVVSEVVLKNSETTYTTEKNKEREYATDILTEDAAEERNNHVESGIIATGMTVIGIAIAVWAGLNIVNAIERKEFKDLNERLAEQTKIELDELLSDTFKESFLIELFNSQEDPFSFYFYSEFLNHRINNIDGIPYDKLLQIEQKYSQVYSMHTSSKGINDILLKYANDGIRIIENIKGNSVRINNNLFDKYLMSRLSDFYFYKGYCEKNEKEICNCFYKAIEGFIELAGKMNLYLPHPSQLPKQYEKSPAVVREDAVLCIYFANAIGESFSKLMRSFYGNDENERKKVGDYAIGYCKLASNWASSIGDNSKVGTDRFNREVYYRNYAVALENYDRIFEDNKTKHCDIILENYKKALCLILDYKESSEKRVGSVYYTLLSYYHRTIEYRSGILKIYDNVDFDNMSDSEQKEKIIKNKKQLLQNISSATEEQKKDIEDSVAILNDFYFATKHANNDKVRMRLIHSMMAFSLRDIIIYKEFELSFSVIKKSFSYSVDYYKEEYKKTFEMIEYINSEDDKYIKKDNYYKLLRAFYNTLL